MLDSYMFHSIISGEEEHSWYLDELIKQGKVFYDHFEKKGVCLIGSLVFNFALHAKHILSHLLSLL